MIEPPQVHQLVDEHVIAHIRRHQDQTPVQGNVSVAPARSPSRALIADADTGDRQTLLGRDLMQPRGQFRARPLTQRPPFLGPDRRRCQPRPLPGDPVDVALHERVGVALRTAARDRDADAAVMLDAKQIPPRPAMANEIDGCDRSSRVGAIELPRVGAIALTLVGAMCLTRVGARRLSPVGARATLDHDCERQIELHTDRITYCERSAISGFTVLARRAGSHTATNETTVSASAMTMNTAGSRACTS